MKRIFQQALETEQRKERLEEQFEFLLSDTPQVTPGKPLQDVCIFLQVSELLQLLQLYRERSSDNVRPDCEQLVENSDIGCSPWASELVMNSFPLDFQELA